MAGKKEYKVIDARNSAPNLQTELNTAVQQGYLLETLVAIQGSLIAVVSKPIGG